MAKYYISSGTLQIIYSTNKYPLAAACCSIWELNENDTLDEYVYVDERGFRNYMTAEPSTDVFRTQFVLEQAGWSIQHPPRQRKKKD